MWFRAADNLPVVVWRFTEHFFLTCSALQDDCSPDTLGLLGKTSGIYSPGKTDPRPSTFQVNVIISRLQSKVFTFLSLEGSYLLAALLQRHQDVSLTWSIVLGIW